MLKITKAILCVLFFMQSATGKEIPGLVIAQTAVVQIVVDNGNGGSGAYIRDGLILTCRHLFGSRRNDADITFNDGQKIRAKFLKFDKNCDIAVMRLVKLPKNIKPVLLARKIPKVGQYLHAVGYGGNSRIKWATGKMRGFSTTRRNSSTTDNFKILNGGVRNGDSGGPIFDNSGELVGVLWGGSSNSTDGTQVGYCLVFLSGVLSPK